MAFLCHEALFLMRNASPPFLYLRLSSPTLFNILFLHVSEVTIMETNVFISISLTMSIFKINFASVCNMCSFIPSCLIKVFHIFCATRVQSPVTPSRGSRKFQPWRLTSSVGEQCDYLSHLLHGTFPLFCSGPEESGSKRVYSR